jgi:hypothetical protein
MSELAVINKRRVRKPFPLLLDPEDAKLLRELASNPVWSKSQTLRAEAVLGIAAGLHQGQLAAEIGYSPASIRRACRRYASEGVAGLIAEKQRPGRPRKYVEGQDCKAEITVREWCRLGRVHAEKKGSGRGRYQSWVISHEELLRIQKEGLLPIRKS